MMMSDRIALLDSGYHPVLSFRESKLKLEFSSTFNDKSIVRYINNFHS